METQTHITPQHREEFNAMLSGQYNNFALFSCFVNGEPACCIVVVNPDDDGQVMITPLFVSVTSSMILTDHEGAIA